MVNPVDLREKATPDATKDFTQSTRERTDLLLIRISTSDGNRAHTHMYTRGRAIHQGQHIILHMYWLHAMNNLPTILN